MSKLPLCPLDDLPSAELTELVLDLLGEVAALKQTLAEQREEIARLKGLRGPPRLKPGKPSGMEQVSAQKAASNGPRNRRGRGKNTLSRVAPEDREDRVVPAEVPAGSRFKGYEGFVVQDLVIRPAAVPRARSGARCACPKPGCRRRRARGCRNRRCRGASRR